MFSNIAQLVEEQETKYRKRLNKEIDLHELNSSIHSPFANERSASSDALLVRIFSYLLPNIVWSDIGRKSKDLNSSKRAKNPYEITSLKLYPLVCKKWYELWTSCVQFVEWMQKFIKKNLKKSSGTQVDENISRKRCITAAMFELPESCFELPLDITDISLDEKAPLVHLSFVYPKLRFSIWRSALNACVFAAKYQEDLIKHTAEEEYIYSDDLDSEDEEEEEPIPLSTPVELPKSGNFRHIYQSIARNGIILMITHGGYFAGGRYIRSERCTNGIEQAEHKTFHKYVTRKKQGKRQISQDKAKRAKSVGSEMRRLNEKHFREQLREHLLEWSYLFKDGETIVFLHSPGNYNKSLIFQFNDSVSADSKNTRQSPVYKSSCFTIPFNTGPQPNNTQLQFAAQRILQVQFTF